MMFAPGLCRKSRNTDGQHGLLESLQELVDLGLVRWVIDPDGELRVDLTQNSHAIRGSAAPGLADSSLLARMRVLHAAGEEDLYA